MGSNRRDSVWWSAPNSLRHRRSLNLVVSDEARAKLARLAGPGGSKSAVVERLIAQAPEVER